MFGGQVLRCETCGEAIQTGVSEIKLKTDYDKEINDVGLFGSPDYEYDSSSPYQQVSKKETLFCDCGSLEWENGMAIVPDGWPVEEIERDLGSVETV